MENTLQQKHELRVSAMAENLIGSEIIKLAGEIRDKIAQGEKIYNFTIGDFNPQIFPIPAEFKQAIINAYQNNETNYPEANGMHRLRKAVSAFLKEHLQLSYNENEILISGGARPIIYALYQTLVDAGDKILFPVPSWNNNHYTHLSHGQQIIIETLPENNFMPTADELKPYIQEAGLIALCSPLNPTGTVFSKNQLEEICDLIIAENKRRGAHEKPLYLMYDQIYCLLTYGNTRHHDPVTLRPEMRNYTVFIDGLSKSLAATGVRVGWAFGPQRIIDKMKSILSHVGAWSPKAEQIATAEYLENKSAVKEFLTHFKNRLEKRLNGFYEMFQKLKNEGFCVDAIAPQAAIYLTVKINLYGKILPDGKKIDSSEQITAYILNEAKIALVPFYAFGSSKESVWYRLSVGTAQSSDIEVVYASLKTALSKLK
jgi:aspartate aminotransferase